MLSESNNNIPEHSVGSGKNIFPIVMIPLEIWLKIAMEDPWVFNRLSRAIRLLGDWSLRNQIFLKNMFTELVGNTYRLPNGWLHRIGGPAIVDGNWYEYWQNGVRHRAGNMPAVYHNNGYEYYVDGKLHRDDGGPAVDLLTRKEWHIHGILHREEGPAIIANSYKEYHINGQFMSRKFYK